MGRISTLFKTAQSATSTRSSTSSRQRYPEDATSASLDRKFASKALLVVAFSVLLVAGSAGVAMADEWGDTGGGDSDTGAHPDEDPHTYCYHPDAAPDTDLRSQIVAALLNALDPTQVDVNSQSSCKFSGTNETDVVWIEDNNLGGPTGTTVCDDWNGFTDTCDQYYVRLDHVAINVGSNDEIDEEQTACHELGHSAGLTHGGSSDCMINSTSSPPSDIQYRRYNNHHIDHLNAWF